MTIETYSNNYTTTLAGNGGSIGSGTTTINIASGTGAPSGQSRFLIGSEIIIGSISGTVLTATTRGAESTTAVTHADGSQVSGVLTVASLAASPGVMTTAGDIEYMTSGGPARLAIGSTGQAIIVSGGLPSWGSAGTSIYGYVLCAAPSGTASTDVTNINAAIASLPSTGGIVQLQAGTYKINSPISVGNGSAGTASTVNGIILRGAAAPALDGNARGTVLQATSSIASVVIVKGPIYGWGLHNLEIDGNGNISNFYTLQVISAQWGDISNLYVHGGPINIRLQSTNMDLGSGASNTMHNSWRNVMVGVGSTNNYVGIQAVGNGSDGTTNTSYEYFTNLTVKWTSSGAGVTAIALYLQGCDNLRFDHVHCFGVTPTGGGANVGCKFDYTGESTGWPADITINDVDWGGTGVTFVNVGTPAASVNRIINISGTNGRPSNPSLSNLDWGYSNASP